MSDSGMLREILKATAESATATKIVLKDIHGVMKEMSEQIGECKNFVRDTKASQDTFRKTTVKICIVVFFAQLTIIGLLLQRLNVKGADVITNTGQQGISREVGHGER